MRGPSSQDDWARDGVFQPGSNQHLSAVATLLDHCASSSKADRRLNDHRMQETREKKPSVVYGGVGGGERPQTHPYPDEACHPLHGDSFAVHLDLRDPVAGPFDIGDRRRDSSL